MPDIERASAGIAWPFAVVFYAAVAHARATGKPLRWPADIRRAGRRWQAVQS